MMSRLIDSAELRRRLGVAGRADGRRALFRAVAARVYLSIFREACVRRRAA